MKLENQTKPSIFPETEHSEHLFALYNLAEDDLESSELLYENGKYRTAVFLLQQSVEKTAKSLALYLNIVTPKEIKREIGHFPPKIYKKMMKKISSGMQEFIIENTQDENAQKILTEMGADINEIVKLVEIPQQKMSHYITKYDRCSISEEDIFEVICQMEEVEFQFDEFQNTVTKYLGEKELGRNIIVIKTIFKMGVFIIPLSKIDKMAIEKNFDELMEYAEPTLEYTEQILSSVIAIFSSGIILFYLSILTAPHAMAARYPEARKNEEVDPVTLYSEEMPYILALPALYHFTELVVDDIAKFYSIATYLPEIAENIQSQSPHMKIP